MGGGLILWMIGFDESPGAVQTEGALTGLRLAYIIVPAVGTLIAMAIMWGYDLDEKRSGEVRRLIDERKAVKAAG